MASLDSRIDELYRGPLTEFVSSRNALARTLTGDEARAVKALKKPAATPYGVNQLFWRARPMYDRLVKAGRALRDAQVAGLKGKKADIRAAIDAHRQALGAAASEAERLAAESGVHVDPNGLAQMLEAVSLATKLPEPAGRFTVVLAPAGFEALAGVPIVASPAAASAPDARQHEAMRDKRAEAVAREKARQAARDEARRVAALRDAERAVEKARTAEARAREAWEDAKLSLEAAENRLRRHRDE